MPNVIKGHPINAERSMNYGNNYIEFFSYKNRIKIKCESELEFSGFVSLEADPTVLRYEIHPGTPIEIDGVKVGSQKVFDALVTYKNGKPQMFIEFKYESELNSKTGTLRSIEQVIAQNAFCKEYGIDYQIITDTDLYKTKGRFFISNCTYILQHVKRLHKAIAVDQAQQTLDKLRDLGGVARIGELINEGLQSETVFNGICALLMQGDVRADIGKAPICYGTEVTINA